MTDTIKHTATVEHVNGNHVTVRILQTSACSSCRAKGFCSSTECKEKLIDVCYDGKFPLHTGQKVMICAPTSVGTKAVLLAFAVPCVLLLATLFVTYYLTHGNEELSAVISLLMLCPYYLILYVLRNKMKRELCFTLQLINH